MTIPKDKNGCEYRVGDEFTGAETSGGQRWMVTRVDGGVMYYRNRTLPPDWGDVPSTIPAQLTILRRADGSAPKRESCGNILRAFHGNDYACDRERAHDGDHSHGSSYSMIGWTEPMGNPIVTRVPAPPITITPRYACGNEARVGDWIRMFDYEAPEHVIVYTLVSAHPISVRGVDPHGDHRTDTYRDLSIFTLALRSGEPIEQIRPPVRLSALGPALAAVSTTDAYDRASDAIAEIWNSTMRQMFDARYPGTPDEPPVKPLPPDYATTYRGFDERVRKIVAEMAPKARVITDRTHETETQGAGMFYEFNFGHGVVKSGVMPFGSYESPEDIAIVLCLEAFEEIGRRGTR